MKEKKLNAAILAVLGFFARMHSFWLFGKSASGLNSKRKTVYYIYNYLLLAVVGIVIGISSLFIANGPLYPREIFFDYFSNPYILFLNLLPPVLLIFLFYGITGRGWISCLLDGGIILGFTLANYYLLKFRDDPLMFSDVLYAREAVNISSEGYDYTPGKRIVFVFLLCIVMSLLLFLFQRHVPKLVARLSLAIVPVVCVFPLKMLYFDSEIYDVKTRNNEHIVPWSPPQLYVSKGFVYPFLNSIQYVYNQKPDGYDEKEIEAVLSKYEDADIPEDKKVNVIGVMLEAFVDLGNKGVTGIDESVYSCYRTIRDENYSGTLVTNIFGGNTIESERAFLTGNFKLENYRHDTNSYVRYFNSQGYYTDGGHPSEGWFYNRKHVNSYLGFADYRLKENYFWEKYQGESMRLNSNFLTNDIMLNFENAKKNGNLPYFSFNVTYQGHGPYASEYYEWGNENLYDNPNISEGSKYILRNYFGSQKDTGWRLMELVNKIKEQDEPIVLVVYGDHMPWLGDSNSVYYELGINTDVSNKEGFLNYFSTEYIIVANDAAKEAVGNDFTGKGPTISPCFLMNVLFEQLGWTGPAYMQYTNSVRETVTAINDLGVIDSENNFFLNANLDEETSAVVNEYLGAQYYRNKNYDE